MQLRLLFAERAEIGLVGRAFREFLFGRCEVESPRPVWTHLSGMGLRGAVRTRVQLFVLVIKTRLELFLHVTISDEKILASAALQP